MFTVTPNGQMARTQPQRRDSGGSLSEYESGGDSACSSDMEEEEEEEEEGDKENQPPLTEGRYAHFPAQLTAALAEWDSLAGAPAGTSTLGFYEGESGAVMDALNLADVAVRLGEGTRMHHDASRRLRDDGCKHHFVLELGESDARAFAVLDEWGSRFASLFGEPGATWTPLAFRTQGGATVVMGSAFSLNVAEECGETGARVEAGAMVVGSGFKTGGGDSCVCVTALTEMGAVTLSPEREPRADGAECFSPPVSECSRPEHHYELKP